MADRVFERMLNQMEAGAAAAAEQRDPELRRKKAEVRRKGRGV